MTRYLIAATILTAVGIAVVGGVAVAVVCRCFARGEAADEHDCGGTCPAHDVGPDDLEAVAEAVGVLAQDAAARMDDYVLSLKAPLSWELAKTPGVRAMTLIDRAAFLATARAIDGLPIYRGGRG